MPERCLVCDGTGTVPTPFYKETQWQTEFVLFVMELPCPGCHSTEDESECPSSGSLPLAS